MSWDVDVDQLYIVYERGEGNYGISVDVYLTWSIVLYTQLQVNTTSAGEATFQIGKFATVEDTTKKPGYIVNEQIEEICAGQNQRNFSEENIRLVSGEAFPWSNRGDIYGNREASTASTMNGNLPYPVGSVPIGKVRCSQLQCGGKMECTIS